MPQRAIHARAGLAGLARNIILAWAFFGGLILCAVVAINVFSVIGGVFWKPFPGDFEMTEIGIAVAAFAFLPYCQMTGANVTADIFTSGASKRTVGIFSFLGSAIAFLFALLLMWRMYYGLLDQKAYNYTTAILQFPHWVAFIPILISLGLLSVASLMTLREDTMQIRKA
jgi:TRAP-type C4-dicarboxylate transport system permease small subunit